MSSDPDTPSSLVLLDRLHQLSERITTLERENKDLTKRLDNNGLTSPYFVRRAFAVIGYMTAAQILIVAIFIVLYLVLGSLIANAQTSTSPPATTVLRTISPTHIPTADTRCKDGCNYHKPGCNIKGDITDGKKIYYLPEHPQYTSITINTADGERWFCNELEPILFGWRAIQ